MHCRQHVRPGRCQVHSRLQIKEPTTNRKMNKKLVIAAVVTIIFGFAAYNLFQQFQAQQVAEIEQEQLERAQSEESARQRQLAQQHEAEKAEKRRQEEAEREARIVEERRLADVERKLDIERKEAEGIRLKMERLARKALKKADREQKRLASNIERARQLRYVESVGRQATDAIASSTRLFIRNNPEKFIDAEYKARALNSGNVVLTRTGANALMLFAMLGQDLDAIGELVSIGIDINSKNEMGYTPLMFAAAYNTAEVVQFMIDQGADTQAINYADEGNALHVAARFNPKPEVLDVLLAAGLDLEGKAKGNVTPLLMAAKYNQNIQVVERLADLGANAGAVASDGSSALQTVKSRLRGGGDYRRFEMISESVNQLVAGKLKEAE
ncbi:ankyrin repeat domain-containing protein [Gammaproteobacteria bacterium]|nr:ankyrin repeat domain-containing protein [Gammaproteobacteria bacterium]